MRSATQWIALLPLWASMPLVAMEAAPTAPAAPPKPVVDLIQRSAPLVAAAQARDHDKVEALLSGATPADVNQWSSDGTTALHWAIYNDDLPLVKRLIAAGANVNASNDYRATPLSEAAVIGNVDILRLLLEKGADVESANADNQTALMIVARTSNVEAARLLLKHGAKVNAREQWRQQTPLMWAVAEAQPAMVKLLLDQGADVDVRSRVNEWERQVTAEPRMQVRPSGGFTALLYAARRGCAECASLLLGKGADVNLSDPDGVSPLLMSLLNGNFDTAAVLLRAGADVDKWDIWGRSPLYAAVDYNTLPMGGRADRPKLDQTTGVELIGMLLDAGANPNLQLKLFPLHRSLRDDRGADTVLGVGSTPLLRAARAGDIAAMKLLLDHGVLVDLPTAAGITPLMAAAGNGTFSRDTRGRYRTAEQANEAVKLLLAAG
ncbi:MAG: ankyrin repeat domain-containing protein, partial [Nevskiaceae bacterium]|nr:ankyrin repeat domain-containing protein [Nevskiaceae bacterium]